jgi:hypothetical protein
MSGGHGGHVDPHNKEIALLISILALVLAWTAGALGAVGIAFCVIGFWFPTAVHLF